MSKKFEPRDQHPTVKLNAQIESGMEVDRFKLDRFLGNGGMGEVWLAIDPNRCDDRRSGHVVLKFLRPEIRLCAQAVDDFRTAYRRVQDLIHENICALLELGHDVNLGAFQVMHFVQGCGLDQILSERRKSGNGRFSLKEVIDYLSPVARALDFAHEHGIIHRDIKPGNIMVDADSGRVRVVDFGLAAEVRTSMSQHSQAKSAISGTESYMAPEQWMGLDQDGRSDQYSLGVVVWEMLTGGLPFVGSGMPLGFAVTNAELPALPPDLWGARGLFSTVLAKKPKDRYASCYEFIKSLISLQNLMENLKKVEIKGPISPAIPPPATPLPTSTICSTERNSKMVSELPPDRVSSSTGMKLKRIDAGSFRMGSEFETPAHQVTLTEPFYMGIYPVTQAEWISVMGTKPWKGKRRAKTGVDFPATCVSWDDAQEFLSRLNDREQDSDLHRLGWRYRLPTEAQWEYSARAGTRTHYSFGEDAALLNEYGWFDQNAKYVREEYAHRVGQKLPNPWGLYDVHGNIEEWCADYFAEDYYSRSDSIDPIGPESASRLEFVPGSDSRRVTRGGHWLNGSQYCRSASRCFSLPGDQCEVLGFRVVQSFIPIHIKGKPQVTASKTVQLDSSSASGNSNNISKQSIAGGNEKSFRLAQLSTLELRHYLLGLSEAELAKLLLVELDLSNELCFALGTHHQYDMLKKLLQEETNEYIGYIKEELQGSVEF